MRARRLQVRTIAQRFIDHTVDAEREPPDGQWLSDRLQIEGQIRGKPKRRGEAATGCLQISLRRLEIELLLRQRGARLQNIGDRSQPDAIPSLCGVEIGLGLGDC